MKKTILSLIMIGAIMATTPLMTYAAMSDDEYSFVSQYDDSTANTELSYVQNSSYIVKIPLRINNLVENGYVFTAQSINILDNEIVRVYAENSSVQMTNERGDTCTLNLSGDGSNGEVGAFRNGESTSTVRMNGQMEMDARAGSYTGTAIFSVKLEPVR